MFTRLHLGWSNNVAFDRGSEWSRIWETLSPFLCPSDPLSARKNGRIRQLLVIAGRSNFFRRNEKQIANERRTDSLSQQLSANYRNSERSAHLAPLLNLVDMLLDKHITNRWPRASPSEKQLLHSGLSSFSIYATDFTVCKILPVFFETADVGRTSGPWEKRSSGSNPARTV